MSFALFVVDSLVREKIACGGVDLLRLTDKAKLMIRHLLLIQFKDEVSQSEIDEVERLFAAIPSKVDGVVSTEWGTNNSPEGKHQGYTHVVCMKFADEDGRQNYLPHPEHDALRAVFKPLVKDIIVFDYDAT